MRARVCTCVCVYVCVPPLFQLPLSFTNYFVTSENRTEYLHKNTYLPALNNQLPTRNASYKAAITSLETMFLVEATEDTVVYPYESEQFGGYKWGTKDTLFTFKEGEIYQEDLIGLKTLDEAGKLKLGSFVGNHLVSAVLSGCLCVCVCVGFCVCLNRMFYFVVCAALFRPVLGKHHSACAGLTIFLRTGTVSRVLSTHTCTLTHSLAFTCTRVQCALHHVFGHAF